MAPSPVWQYFEKTADGSSVKCTRCNKIFKFNKSTTSLSTHLKVIHKIELKKVSGSELLNAEGVGVFVGPLDKSFQSISAFGVDGHKHKSLLTALMFMIVKDNMPLQTPQKEGFKMFCKKLQPLYHPPSVITLTDCLNKKYKELATKIKNEMRQASSICLTTDLWTHKYTMQSYLGITSHYLTGTTIKTVELGAYPMNDRKTIENIRAKLRDICNDWGLKDDQISAIVSDGGANIKGAIREEFGQFKHISCFAHIINNIGQRVIEINIEKNSENAAVELLESSGDEENLEDTVSLSENFEVSSLRHLLCKVKSIVKFFRSSEVATNELKTLQMEGNNGKYLKLIQEVRTRWNSCYEMVERFILLTDYVGRVLLQVHRDRSSRAKPPNMLTGDELQVLAEVKDILKPLWSITQEISAEKSVTISKCIPLIAGLIIKLNALNPLTVIGKRIKDKLCKEVDDKFHSIESVRAYAAATLLDPRFKKLAFRNIREAARAVSYVGDLVKKEIQNARSTLAAQCDELEVQDVVATDPDDIWYFLDSSVISSRNRKSSVDEDAGIPIQLRHYLSSPTVNRKANPNPFIAWQAMENEYPYVWKVAKMMLPIVATSVPSERLFSHAGIIANQLRSRLSPQHLNILVFLHSLEEDMWFQNTNLVTIN